MHIAITSQFAERSRKTSKRRRADQLEYFHVEAPTVPFGGVLISSSVALSPFFLNAPKLKFLNFVCFFSERNIFFTRVLYDLTGMSFCCAVSFRRVFLRLIQNDGVEIHESERRFVISLIHIFEERLNDRAGLVPCRSVFSRRALFGAATAAQQTAILIMIEATMWRFITDSFAKFHLQSR